MAEMNLESISRVISNGLNKKKANENQVKVEQSDNSGKTCKASLQEPLLERLFKR